MARIIPVIDLKGGSVVRAVAGDRANYRPIRSRIVAGSEPVAVAIAMMNAVKSREIYVADLDAFESGTLDPSIAKLASMTTSTIWLDYGAQTPDAISNQLLQHANVNIILASETCADHQIASFLAQWPRERLALGIDLKAGRLVTPVTDSPAMNLSRYLEKIALYPINDFFLIDIACVGCSTANVMRYCELAKAFADRHVVFGGGLKAADIAGLPESQGVLVSSAIHDGSLNKLLT